MHRLHNAIGNFKQEYRVKMFVLEEGEQITKPENVTYIHNRS